MQKKKILALCLTTSMLLAPSIGLSLDVLGRSLGSSLNPGPSTVALDILYQSMNIDMTLIALYYQKNNTCPPKDYFLKNVSSGANIIQYVTNGSNCDVVGQFSNSAPGSLKNKTIRIVVKVSGENSDADFSFRQVVTDIDMPGSNNRVAPVIFLSPQKEFGWSNTVMPSNFGNAISVRTNLVKTLSYAALAAYNEQNASEVDYGTTSTSTNGPTMSSTIQSV